MTTRMAGSSRLFNLCRQMSRRHRLTLAFFRRSQDREKPFMDDPDNQGVFQEFATLPSCDDLGLPAPTWLNRQSHRLTFEPYFSLRRIAPTQLRRCREVVGQLLDRNRIDLLYVDGASMVQHVPSNCAVPSSRIFATAAVSSLRKSACRDTSLAATCLAIGSKRHGPRGETRCGIGRNHYCHLQAG